MVILPVSPEGTKVMTRGFSGEPSWPAATVGMLGNLSHFIGMGVLVGPGVFVAAATTGAGVFVGGTGVLVGAGLVAVGGTAVGGTGVAVGAAGTGVAAGAAGTGVLVGAGGLVAVGGTGVAVGVAPQALRIVAATISATTNT